MVDVEKSRNIGSFLNAPFLHEAGDVSRLNPIERFNEYSSAEKKQVLESHIQFMAVEYGFTDYIQTDDRRGLYPLVVVEIDKYQKVIDELHDEVSSPEAVQRLREISVRYQNTAELPLPDYLKSVRSDNPRIVVFDFDNTISDFKQYRNDEDVIDPLLTGSEALDPLIGSSREYALPIIAGMWNPVAKAFADSFASGGEEVPFRKGMKELLEFLVKEGVSVKIISANFSPFIKAALQRIEGGDKIEAFSMRDEEGFEKDARPIFKGNLLKKIQLENENAVIEYVGDGTSDMHALAAAAIIPGIHTVRGESFSRKMNEKRMPHLDFSNGFELGKNLGFDISQAA